MSNAEEYQFDRSLVEDFARLVVEVVGDYCLAVVLLPWTSGAPPPGVVCPIDSRGALDASQLTEAIHGRTVVVVGCTFKFIEEETAAFRVVEQLLGIQGVCLLVAHVLAPGNNYQLENYDNLLQVHRRINALCAHGMILDPEREPVQLKQQIRMAHETWRNSQERLKAALAAEPQGPSSEDIAAMEAKKWQLLWVDIPNELMPHFKPMGKGLPETEHKAGDYTLTDRMHTQVGCVWEGHDKHDKKVVLKVVPKSEVSTPGEVEGIYREYRFLAGGFIKHPGVARALNCFHGPQNVYTVLEFGGKENLGMYLSRLPGHQMPQNEATECFLQFASALSHCHNADICHRSISLEHIVMKPEAHGSHRPLLVDFRSAMIAKPGVPSVTMFGTLPCMSPEVLGGESYLPKEADCWSAGVILLEMVGGKGCFLQAVQIYEEEALAILGGDEDQRAELAQRIYAYYLKEGSHAAALADTAENPSDDILDILENLLQEEENRACIDEFTSPEELPS